MPIDYWKENSIKKQFRDNYVADISKDRKTSLYE